MTSEHDAVAALRELGSRPRGFTMRVPFVPKAKKNKGRIVYRGRGRCSKCLRPSSPPLIVPDAQVTAEEDAIAALFRAQRAFNARAIDLPAAEKVAAVATSRATKRSGVGEKTLARALAGAGIGVDGAPLFDARDVAMTVDVHVGKKPNDDYVMVALQDAGPRLERERQARHRDVINVPALIADALNALAYDDDCNVVDLRVRLVYDSDTDPGGSSPTE